MLKVIKEDGDAAGDDTQYRKASMRDLGATSVESMMELSKEALVEAFTENNYGSTDIGKRMLRWAELQRVRASTSAGILLVLFLLHAPVSQRIFHYFVCHDIAGRSFLRVDYSLSCTEEKYVSFRAVPLLMLVIFTAGIPIVIFMLLFLNRNHLHTPSVRAQLGFLYASFRPNAGEFWEVHELLRKLMLMGALVLIDSTKVRMIVALLVCVVSLVSLNYFRPHKNSVVLMVAQASFLLTTFKYILAIVLDDVTESERDTLGMVLIFMDVCFVLGSVGSLFAVCLLLYRTGHVEGSSSTTKIKPSRTPKQTSRRSLSITQVRTAVVHEKVRMFELEHAEFHAKAISRIQTRKMNAQVRVRNRLEHRRAGRISKGNGSKMLGLGLDTSS